MRRTFMRTLVPLAATIALIGAGCSDDDDDDGGATDSAVDDTAIAEPTAPSEGVAAGDTTTPDSAAGSTTPDTVEPVQEDGESLLDTVIANDVVRCGVNENLAGFAAINAAGETEGFDADFCRVIAAGVLGDATKVEFVPLNADARFPALQAGEIDVLVRNTTWTASRDGTTVPTSSIRRSTTASR